MAGTPMGFFNNPGKAFKGFVKDPVGRIGKDLDKIAKPAQVFYFFMVFCWLTFRSLAGVCTRGE